MMQLEEVKNLLEERYHIEGVTGVKRTSEGLQNNNYIVTTEKSRYILKDKNKQVYDEKEDREREEKIAWIITSIGRELSFIIGPKLNLGGDFTSVQGENVYLLYPFIEGIHCDYDKPDVISEVGEKIALFHDASVKYSELCPIKEDYAFESRLASLKSSSIADDELVIQAINIFESQSKPLAHSPVIIHGDLTPTNIIFNNGKIEGIIDFDNIRVSEREEEIVRFVMSFEGEHFSELASSFISNYKKKSKGRVRLTRDKIKYYAYKDLIEEIAIWNNNILQANQAKPITFYIQMLGETLKKATRMENIIGSIERISEITFDRE